MAEQIDSVEHTTLPGQRLGGGGLEAQAFEALVREASPGLYRLALSLVRDTQAAEDLVQDTFLRAFERRGQFRDAAAPSTWLRRILVNLAADRARRHPREVLVEDVEERWQDDDYTVSSEVVIERAETRAELEDAIVRLPFIYRAVLLLHDVEELTVVEVAKAVEIGVPAAKQRLRRGRMMLVSALAAGSGRRVALEGVPLRCWDARQLVSDYMNGELAPAERSAVEGHLETCPTCPPLYAALVGVRAQVAGLRDPDSVIPPRLADRISARLNERGLSGRTSSDPDPPGRSSAHGPRPGPST
jgi:RNA polymerase sigma-70 factor, ECF subfamily